MISLLLGVCLMIEVFNMLGAIPYHIWEGKYIHTYSSLKFKLNLLDRLHLKLGFVQNRHPWSKCFNTYNFVFLSIVLGVVAYVLFYYMIRVVVPSLVIGSVVACIPYFSLEVFVDRREMQVARNVTVFISTMARWSIIHDDIYFCFEKASQTIGSPLKEMIEMFLIQIRYTGDFTMAYNQLLLQSNNELYRNFIMNIRQADYAKGNLTSLLMRLEEEAYRIEGEQSRRESETYFDRLVIMMTTLLVTSLTLVIFTFNTQMRLFYLQTKVGQYLLSLFAVLFFLGLYQGMKIKHFNY